MVWENTILFSYPTIMLFSFQKNILPEKPKSACTNGSRLFFLFFFLMTPLCHAWHDKPIHTLRWHTQTPIKTTTTAKKGKTAVNNEIHELVNTDTS